jgi:16S rRNA (guanine966-N2)-methyltransferase
MPPYKNQIRIIGGTHKRRLVRFPDMLGVDGFRPTPDRVRETVFNWLGQNLDGKRCLDVFAGSGALAFEAASRGAAKVIAVESSLAAMQAIRKNASVLDLPNLQLVNADAFGFLASTPEKFDVIFIDPPFAQDWWARLAPLIARVAAPEASVYCEYAKELRDKDLAGFTRTRQGRAGVVNYHLFQPIAAPPAATTASGTDEEN